MPPFAYPTPEPTDPSSSREESKTRKRDISCSTADTDHEPSLPVTKRQKVLVQCGNLCYPASRYGGHRPSLPVVNERQAINELAEIWNAGDHSQDEHNIWQLNDFVVYREPGAYRHANELCPVHHLNSEDGINDLLFDGTLSVDNEVRSVQAVPFGCLAIEGYGDESDVVSACIQSSLGRKGNVWYQLGRPAKEYARYYDVSRWMFRFAKYVVEFLEDSGPPVTLDLFRRLFHSYVNEKYGLSIATKEWLSKHPSVDFGQAFCANIGFLIRECYGLDSTLLDHPIFDETDPRRLRAIPKEAPQHDKTVVTPLVFESFRRMPFSSQMQVLKDVDVTVIQKQRSRRLQMGLTPLDCASTSAPIFRPTSRAVKRGDVVSVAANKESRWKASLGTSWFAYVQEIRTMKTGLQKLDVIWLYDTSDTTLGHGYYPYKNELFMSDNCSCGQDSVDAALVQSIVPVQWYATDPEESKGFFVRQKFRTEPTLGAYDFVQLHESDFDCECRNTETEMEKVRKDFRMGDTVMVHHLTGNTETLEPAIIRGFSLHKITLQPLLRSGRDLGEKQAPPNQVVPADDIYEVGPESITRRCTVASFKSLEHIRAPYDRDGAGDMWFVISQSDPTWNFQNHEIAADSKLKGMGIFCGGGSLDRGLEEGGGLEFKWAVDMAEHALHTYRANAKDPDGLKLFLGSVDDYLAKALRRSADSRIATVGDIDFLAAGSPCPGFSVLQQNKDDVKSLRNCSLVASVCSFVDLYMPSYLVLENVIGMAANPKNSKELNVFSQVLCCLVSMGYQVKQLLMDPGFYGSCQSRQRIFIVATAPGCTPPDAPPQTHSCKELERSRAIGRASNGVPFGERRKDVCSFVSLTTQHAFRNLPDISEGHVQTCIPAPDHRLCRFEDSRTRAIIQSVPRWPRGQGFVQAVAAGKMYKRAIAEYPWKNKNRGAKTSRSWSRLYPNGQVGCLTTSIKPHCAFNGRTLHWDQPRLMTVMEARRVQGIPDNEIVVGLPSAQWRQIGNGVDRKVAFAMGMQLAIAFRKNGSLVSALPTTLKTDERHEPSQIKSVIREETIVRRSLQSASTKASGSFTVFERKLVSSVVLDDSQAAAVTRVRGLRDSQNTDGVMIRDDGIELIIID
ncbi:S-adenosyl-L-methionine-dependent methyltransferase [Aureobasidium pullulans]|uniref:DNA (cytosine-5-)-methyltransferase n=1 Tax=Aureobasidium pullulans TaxID=5580 RepID=A0A4T0BEG1_AURPU|nr:S-adenosyl-L-methionine-dependent methyltransferase [Aureobasidium pullulans]